RRKGPRRRVSRLMPRFDPNRFPSPIGRRQRRFARGSLPLGARRLPFGRPRGSPTNLLSRFLWVAQCEPASKIGLCDDIDGKRSGSISRAWGEDRILVQGPRRSGSRPRRCRNSLRETDIAPHTRRPHTASGVAAPSGGEARMPQPRPAPAPDLDRLAAGLLPPITGSSLGSTPHRKPSGPTDDTGWISSGRSLRGELTSVDTSCAVRSSAAYGASSSRSDVALSDGSSHRPRSGSSRITGIRSWIPRTNGFAAVVMIV